MTVNAPTSIPANAPVPVIRRQNNDINTTGPNAAPKPAQAYETNPNTLLSGFWAMTMAIAETKSTMKRPIQTSSFCVAVGRINPL